jgi:hypothetical protein
MGKYASAFAAASFEIKVTLRSLKAAENEPFSNLHNLSRLVGIS